MLNKFPIWKYLLVLAVLAIGLLYASPNLYGRDPAIQVSGAKGTDVDLSVVDKVNARENERLTGDWPLYRSRRFIVCV